MNRPAPGPVPQRASTSSIAATPLQIQIRQAVERVEQETSLDFDADDWVTPRILLRSLADVVEGVGPGPDLSRMSPKARDLAIELEIRLLGAVLADAAAKGEHAELVPVLRAFARLHRQLAAARPNSGGVDAPSFRARSVHLAHDFRSPLTSILFLADSLRRGQSGAVNEVQQRQLGIIYSATLGLSTLANDVVEFARPGEHLLDWQCSRFSLRELLDSVINLVQPLREQRGVDLRTLSPPEDARSGYPATLQRVLLNLATNALQCTEEGMVEVTARDLGEDRVEFAVRDTGRGLDEEAQAHLFQPFRARRDAGYSLNGYGLGLSICRKLVHALNSDLRYETAPGWGTRFYFIVRLPRPTPAGV